MSPVEKSRYVADFLPCKDFAGRDMIAFVVKRTYELLAFEGKLAPLAEQPPILKQDEPFDDGEVHSPSVRYEAELVPPFSPTADVLVLGRAHAPGGEPAPEFTCALHVGPHCKRLRIVGSRRCVFVPPRKTAKVDKKTGQPKKEVIAPPPLFTDPEPVLTVELRMKNAYGGESYLVPSSPEAFERALEEAAERREEEIRERAEYEERKRAKEEAEAREARQDPNRFFSDGGAEGARSTGPDQPDTEGPGDTSPPAADPADWGQRGTAGEGPRGSRDGATQVLRPGEPDGALEDAGTDTAASDLGAGHEAGEGGAGTRVFLAGRMRSTEDPDWAEREREALDADDAQRRAAAEKARKERAEAEALPWPRLLCPQNPVGKGFALGNLRETIDGLELPLIEDPDSPLTPEAVPRDVALLLDESKAVMPVTLGCFPKTFWPRALKGGVMPAEREVGQAVIDDFVVERDLDDPDERAAAEAALDFELPVMKPDYYSAAPGGLQLDKLDGDEEVRLENLAAHGTTLFRLPGDHPLLTLDRGAGREPVPVRLERLVIEPDDTRVTMVWRGSLPYGGHAEFERYPRFDLDVEESDVRTRREADARAEIAARAAEGATGVVAARESDDEPPAEDIYRRHVDRGAEKRADEASREAGATGNAEEGTRALGPAAAGDHKIVSDDQFEGWIDKERPAQTERDAASLRAQKKEAVRKRLAELNARKTAPESGAPEPRD